MIFVFGVFGTLGVVVMMLLVGLYTGVRKVVTGYGPYEGPSHQDREVKRSTSQVDRSGSYSDSWKQLWQSEGSGIRRMPCEDVAACPVCDFMVEYGDSECYHCKTQFTWEPRPHTPAASTKPGGATPAKRNAGARSRQPRPSSSKSDDRLRCEGRNRNGDQCRNKAMQGERYCRVHGKTRTSGSVGSRTEPEMNDAINPTEALLILLRSISVLVSTLDEYGDLASAPADTAWAHNDGSQMTLEEAWEYVVFMLPGTATYLEVHGSPDSLLRNETTRRVTSRIGEVVVKGLEWRGYMPIEQRTLTNAAQRLRPDIDMTDTFRNLDASRCIVR